VLLPDRHHAVSQMLIVTGIRRELVRRTRVFVTRLLPRILVDLHMGDELVAPLLEAGAPVDRLAAAQTVENVPSQRRRYFARAAVGKDGNADAMVRQQRHRLSPARPAAAMPDEPITVIGVGIEAKAIMRLAELRLAGRGDVDARRMQLADQRGRQQALAVELAFGQM